MKSVPSNAALLVIDVQQAFNNPTWGKRNNLSAESNIAKLIAKWRDTSRPLIHVQHRSSSPEGLFNAQGAEFKKEARPLSGEPIIQKAVNSAFIGTNLEVRLRDTGITSIVIIGITTDHCVSTTARMAGNLGFETCVVSDATATFERWSPEGRYHTAEAMHDTALTSLSGEFATILDTHSVLSRLL